MMMSCFIFVIDEFIHIFHFFLKQNEVKREI